MTFFGRSEVVPIRTHRVPQTIETSVTFESVPNAYIRFAYARSSDSMNSRVEGQDYLCFQHNDQRLVFVVCDGVGSSFCGNLAARILGDALLEWLWALDIGYIGGAAALSEAATSQLNRIQKHAQHEVAEYEIPNGISGLVRQALEAQRAYGSEAIFAAARIDYPGPMFADGLISVMWMGDTQIHVLGEGGGHFDLGGVFDNANRWSSAQGVKGRMSAWMRELDSVGRVVAFTDGLSAHAVSLSEFGDSKLDQEIHAGSRLATSDDVAFIDVVIRSPRYEGYPDPELPDPNLERPHLEQIWNPMGTDTYELRWKGSDKDRFLIQEATNPALNEARTIEVPPGATSWRPTTPQQPGHFYYRVRAIRKHGGMTPWSELRLTKVAYPPPPAPTLHPVEPGKTPTLVWTSVGDTIDYTLEQSSDPSFAEPEIVYSGRGTSWTVPVNQTRPGMYYYRVQAISDGGSGPWSTVQTLEIQAPPPPKPHLGSPNYGYEYGSYELRWQPVPGASHYELQQREQESGEEMLVETSDAIYPFTNQPIGHYVYRVRACNEFVCSEWSNEQTVAITPQAPTEAPELTLEGPDEDGTLHFKWTEVPGVEEYEIELSEEPAFRNAKLVTQEQRSLEIVRREPGSLYVRVCGVNAGGTGPWSNVTSIAIAPAAPGWIEAVVTDQDRLQVSWGAVGGRPSYTVEVEASSEATAIRQELYHGPETQFEMAVPKVVDWVIFQVRAELPGVQSAWQTSDPVQLGTSLEAPWLEQPQVDDKSSVQLRWNAIEGATSYILEAARNDQFKDAKTAGSIPKTEIVFNAPTSGQYWFRMRAVHPSGTSRPSNVVSVQIRRPSPPQLWPLDPVRAGAGFEVTWKGMPGCVYYELEESGSPSFEVNRTQTKRIFHPAQKLGISGHPAGEIYFRVRAVDEQNQPSVWSDVLTVEIL